MHSGHGAGRVRGARGASVARRFLPILLIFGLNRPGFAEGSVVPPEIQAELLSKLSLHDRSFSARAGQLARIAILVKAGSSRSDRSASVIREALAQLERFGGLPHVETVVVYEAAPAVARRCRDEHVAVVYV